jgi:hypothetical protein
LLDYIKTVGLPKLIDPSITDGVADMIVYAADFANSEGFKLSNIVDETWRKVRRRDWLKDSKKGGENNG